MTCDQPATARCTMFLDRAYYDEHRKVHRQYTEHSDKPLAQPQTCTYGKVTG